MQDKKEIILILKALPFIQNDLIYFYNYHSNKIENNSLTYGETITVLKDGFGVSKPLRDIKDMENHNKALNYVFKLAKNKEAISLRTIREIQALLEPEKTGFRTTMVEILNTSTKTAEPFEIALKVQDLVDNYNNSKETLLKKIAKFHIAFEKIHPFIDGNGRTGRLLMNFELLKADYPLTTIKFEDRPAYYDAFEDENKMLKIIEKSIEDTINLIKNKAK